MLPSDPAGETEGGYLTRPAELQSRGAGGNRGSGGHHIIDQYNGTGDPRCRLDQRWRSKPFFPSATPLPIVADSQDQPGYRWWRNSKFTDLSGEQASRVKATQPKPQPGGRNRHDSRLGHQPIQVLGHVASHQQREARHPTELESLQQFPRNAFVPKARDGPVNARGRTAPNRPLGIEFTDTD